METAGRKKLLNIIMAVVIAVIVFCGVMATGVIRGWFGSGSDSQIFSDKISGIANIERNGVGYSLKENVPLEVGDIVETERGSTAVSRIAKDNALTMGEESEISISANQKNDIAFSVVNGEVFSDVPEAGDSFKVDFGGNTADVKESVFSTAVRQGSSTLGVFKGSVTVAAEDGTEVKVNAGECLSVAHSGDGSLAVDVAELKPESMSDFLVEQALNCSDSDSLCFTADSLRKLQETRTAEKEKARKAAAERDAVGMEDGEDGGRTDVANTGESRSGTGNSAAGGSSGVTQDDTCTIEIRCDTILNNMGDLTPGKDRYVPANGIILATSTVEFKEGETVFDVLKRVCSYAGIQIEYSYTPMYGSYYIEGINNLYEFDCGQQSGWMYKVNGWFPNYGCSEYTLKDGDTIVWCYTCKGLGADVGASGFSY